MRVGVVSVVELDVVVAAIGLFLHLEGDEAELHAVALLGHQQPLAVRVSWVVVVPELGVRVEVALAHLGLQAAAAFCKEGRREGGKEGRRGLVCLSLPSMGKLQPEGHLPYAEVFNPDGPT